MIVNKQFQEWKQKICVLTKIYKSYTRKGTFIEKKIHCFIFASNTLFLRIHTCTRKVSLNRHNFCMWLNCMQSPIVPLLPPSHRTTTKKNITSNHISLLNFHHQREHIVTNCTKMKIRWTHRPVYHIWTNRPMPRWRHRRMRKRCRRCRVSVMSIWPLMVAIIVRRRRNWFIRMLDRICIQPRRILRLVYRILYLQVGGVRGVIEKKKLDRRKTVFAIIFL